MIASTEGRDIWFLSYVKANIAKQTVPHLLSWPFNSEAGLSLFLFSLGAFFI